MSVRIDFMSASIDVILRGYYHDKTRVERFTESGKNCSFANAKNSTRRRTKGSDAGRDDRREEIDVRWPYGAATTRVVSRRAVTYF